MAAEQPRKGCLYVNNLNRYEYGRVEVVDEQEDYIVILNQVTGAMHKIPRTDIYDPLTYENSGQKCPDDTFGLFPCDTAIPPNLFNFGYASNNLGNDFENVLVDCGDPPFGWGGSQAWWNSGVPQQQRRALGYYLSSNAGKSLIFWDEIEVPEGTTQITVKFKFFMSWARFTWADRPRYASFVTWYDDDTATVDRGYVDNFDIDGSNLFRWYDAGNSPQVIESEMTYATTPGTHYVYWKLGQGNNGFPFPFTPPSHTTHPTISVSNGRNINAAFDNIEYIFE